MIPIISIRDGSEECASQLVQAAREWGFLYIDPTNSGIGQDKIDRMFELSRKFFASPREEKQSCAITDNNKGWSSMGTETLDPQNQRRGDFKEALNFGEFLNGKAQQSLPPSLTTSEHELDEFTGLCHNLCLRLLRLFAIGLKIDPVAGGSEWFASRHDRSKGASGSILRLLYYPSLPPHSDYIPALDIRAGAHSDYGSLTLLFQLPHQDGLEILTPTGWEAVPAIPAGLPKDAPAPILVNLGDLLSYWTAGLLRSTVHRVVFPHDLVEEQNKNIGKDRYSIVYFCHPVNETLLVPIPSEIVKERGGRGANAGAGTEEEEEEGEKEKKKKKKKKKLLTAKDHLMERLGATYGWGKK